MDSGLVLWRFTHDTNSKYVQHVPGKMSLHYHIAGFNWHYRVYAPTLYTTITKIFLSGERKFTFYCQKVTHLLNCYICFRKFTVDCQNVTQFLQRLKKLVVQAALKYFLFVVHCKFQCTCFLGADTGLCTNFWCAGH